MTIKELLKDDKFLSEVKEAVEKLSSKDDEDILSAIVSAAEKYGVKATKEEIEKCLTSSVALSDDELDNVAGGCVLAKKGNFLSGILNNFFNLAIR